MEKGSDLTKEALETFLVDYLKQYVKPESSPHSAHDALVLLVHAVLARAGFKLVALGETGALVEEKQIPAEWNASKEAWALRYRHSRSSLTFVVKALSLGDQLLVHAAALELTSTQPPCSLQLRVADFMSPNAVFSTVPEWTRIINRDSLPRLVSEIERQLVRSLVPEVGDLSKQSDTTAQRVDQRSEQGNDPLRIPPRQPLSPPRPDPLRDGPGGFGNPYGPGGFGVGRGDMPGPGHPLFPPGRGGWDEGGGNLVGPNHPGFGPLVRDPFARPQGGRGDGFGGHPPGARFDPFGPPGVNRPWPDNDELPPPGPPSSGAWEDMFM